MHYEISQQEIIPWSGPIAIREFGWYIVENPQPLEEFQKEVAEMERKYKETI